MKEKTKFFLACILAILAGIGAAIVTARFVEKPAPFVVERQDVTLPEAG